jgi:hypothetical protein
MMRFVSHRILRPYGPTALVIPPLLESRREEIKQLIREGLEEYAYLRAAADGGTYENPNTVARANIISIEIEFK